LRKIGICSFQKLIVFCAQSSFQAKGCNPGICWFPFQMKTLIR
jgi:hypothetical protein